MAFYRFCTHGRFEETVIKILRIKRTLALSHAVIVYPQMSDLAVWKDGEV